MMLAYIAGLLGGFSGGFLLAWWLRRPTKRHNVFRFSTGQEVAALHFFEWLAITPAEKWPPMGEVIDVARAVGGGLSAVEIDRIVTAVRPMAVRAIERGQKALRA